MQLQDGEGAAAIRGHQMKQTSKQAKRPFSSAGSNLCFSGTKTHSHFLPSTTL